MASTAFADDHGLTFEEIVDNYGYPLESYSVITADGYILETFRIPHGRDQDYDASRPAVLLQHGYFDSADFSVMNGPEKSIAFYLANQGFDVWIGNGRGNKFSRNHQTLNPDKDSEFWAYSFVERHEDDKANIDFIREQTGQNKISVIAHSEATATFWTAMSEDPEYYQERVNYLAALGPISRLDHMKGFLLRSLASNPFAIGLVKLLGYQEFMDDNFQNRLWFKHICGAIPQFCQYSTKIISDGDLSVDDLDAMRVYYGHYPSGISVKALEHTLQIYKQGKFQYFDYGKKKNTEIYGSETPPLINLGNISGVPISMFVGTTDLLSDIEDNLWLKEQLGSNVVEYRTYEYGHVTFFIGKDIDYLEDLVQDLQKYQ